MLVKIMVSEDGKTIQFDSREVPIAIILDDSSKQAIEKMPPDQQLILSAPFKFMTDSAKAWTWAYSDWQGATLVSPADVELGSEIIARN